MSDQLTQEDLKSMKPADIVKAQSEGRLDALLGVPREDHDVIARATNGGTLTPADCEHLAKLGRHDLIVTATQEDRINYDPTPAPADIADIKIEGGVFHG